ncbi:MAG: hypothetical protein R3175_08365 [Marinobacter sp.]|uniref:hypothetical protein n=1 Tax=Marinobacter sp. TaxID=50741 RepID=UPI00299F50F9|nr:hypothetical protein [Marinobacter sp.]MDX1756055.1 hypothetical protein [Marinobacter sp.]
MSNTLWVLLVVVIMVAGLVWFQKTRMDRTLQALVASGFEVSRQWRANLLVVADDHSGRLALVWPNRYQVLSADQLMEVAVRDQEMEGARHRYSVQLRFDHPEVREVGLALHQRGDRAQQWARELLAWRDRHRAPR